MACGCYGTVQFYSGNGTESVAEKEDRKRNMSVYCTIYKKLESFELDAEIHMGQELLVIEGASGAGKTTILNCLAGIRKPDRGKISVEGRILFDHESKTDIPANKRNIGYVFQNYALFPNMTVKANVLYGLKNKKEYRKKETKKELLDFVDYMMETLGIRHLADRKPGRISGGEKQRTALARALVTKPSLLLLDEPFSALDTDTKEKVYEEFGAFKETLKIPTILITHDHKESRLFADKIITLKEGRII